MPHRPRLAAALTAGTLATLALSSGAAHAATIAPNGGAFKGAAKPALAHALMHRAATDTGDGVTATTTDVAGDGLTESFDATASTDSNPGDTITGYSFDYGDGTATVQNATGTANHTYAQPGTYTATITVTDSGGNSAQVQTTFTTAGSDFTPVSPTRILDTRNGTGAPEAAVGNNQSIKLQIAGIDGVPSDATGAVVHIAAADQTSGGVLICYPDGTSQPAVSNLNYPSTGTLGNMMTVQLGADGGITCTNTDSTGTTELIGDLEGYYAPAPASGYAAIQPGRILDTRSGLGAPKAQPTTGQTIALKIDGATATTSETSAGVPTTETLPASGITAVSLNLIAVNSPDGGYVSAYPAGTTEPSGNVLNFTTDPSTSAVIVPVGANGEIDLTVSETTDLVADINGYYSATALTASSPTAAATAVYVPVPENRQLDTRTKVNGSIQAETFRLDPNLTNANGVTAYILNATITDPSTGGDLVIVPDGSIDGNNVATSNINFNADETIANLVQATASSTGIDFYAEIPSGTTQLILDEFGYFTTQ